MTDRKKGTNLFDDARKPQIGDKVTYLDGNRVTGFIIDIDEDDECMPYSVGDSDGQRLWVDKVRVLIPVEKRLIAYPPGTPIWFQSASMEYAERGTVCKYDGEDVCLPYLVRQDGNGHQHWVDSVSLIETFIPPPQETLTRSVAVEPPASVITHAYINAMPHSNWVHAHSQNRIQLKESHMTKINNVVARTKASAVSVATIQAGKAANMAVIKAVRPHMPMMVRGYMDHPLAPAIIAMGLAAASEYLPAGTNKQKLVKLTDCMMTAAIADGADKYLNIEAFMDTIFAGMPVEVCKMLDEGYDE